MTLQKYWYVSGPLLVILGVVLVKVIDEIMGVNGDWYIAMHIFMLPTLLMLWCGLILTIGTLGYMTVQGIQKLMKKSKK